MQEQKLQSTAPYFHALQALSHQHHVTCEALGEAARGLIHRFYLPRTAIDWYSDKPSYISQQRWQQLQVLALNFISKEVSTEDTDTDIDWNSVIWRTVTNDSLELTNKLAVVHGAIGDDLAHMKTNDEVLVECQQFHYEKALGLLNRLYVENHIMDTNFQDGISPSRFKAQATDKEEYCLSCVLYNLAEIYRLGKGVEKDTSRALMFYQHAANRQHLGATAVLAWMHQRIAEMCDSAEDSAHHERLAFELYNRVANWDEENLIDEFDRQKKAEACYVIANAYNHGQLGKSKNNHLALEFAKKSSSLSSKNGQCLYAQILYLGMKNGFSDLTIKTGDPDKLSRVVFNLFKKSNAQKNGLAAYFCGHMLENNEVRFKSARFKRSEIMSAAVGYYFSAVFYAGEQQAFERLVSLASYNKVKEAFTRDATRTSNLPEAQFAMALFYIATNDRKKAKFYLEQVISRKQHSEIGYERGVALVFALWQDLGSATQSSSLLKHYPISEFKPYQKQMAMSLIQEVFPANGLRFTLATEQTQLDSLRQGIPDAIAKFSSLATLEKIQQYQQDDSQQQIHYPDAQFALALYEFKNNTQKDLANYFDQFVARQHESPLCYQRGKSLLYALWKELKEFSASDSLFDALPHLRLNRDQKESLQEFLFQWLDKNDIHFPYDEGAVYATDLMGEVSHTSNECHYRSRASYWQAPESKAPMVTSQEPKAEAPKTKKD